MNINCKFCGAKVPRYGATERVFHTGTQTTTTEPQSKAGQPHVSTWMYAVDPDGLFCTLRCAARYGIRQVRREMVREAANRKTCCIVEHGRVSSMAGLCGDCPHRERA